MIKANFPARIAFKVTAKVDSRTILDMNGAESLLGKGDMLFLPPGKGEPTRLHGSFVSDRAAKRIVDAAYDWVLDSGRLSLIGRYHWQDEMFFRAQNDPDKVQESVGTPKAV